jgi:hypothetical protein
MKINKFIDHLIENDSLLKKQMKTLYPLLSKKKRDDKKILSAFLKLSEKFPANIKITSLFLDFIQLIDSEELIAEYDFDDIEKLFKKSCAMNEENYDLHLEYYYFLFNMLDKEKEAKKMLAQYVKMMKAKFEKMSKLLS